MLGIHIDFHVLLLIALAGIYAGMQNVLAGGGSFITFPALMLAGLNPLAANMTSTIALFPSQITSVVAGRSLLSDVGSLSFRRLFLVSCLGLAACAALFYSSTPRQPVLPSLSHGWFCLPPECSPGEAFVVNPYILPTLRRQLCWLQFRHVSRFTADISEAA